MAEKLRNILSGSICVMMLVTAAARGNAPVIQEIGAPEDVGASGLKPSLATDSQGNPHIVANASHYAYFYDRVGPNNWSGKTVNMHPITVPAGQPSWYNSGTFNNPHIEIDANDRAWYSGVLFGWTVGMGLFVRENIVSDHSAPTHFSWYNVNPTGWPVGESSLDPARPDEFILTGSAGYWQKMTYNGADNNDRVTPGPVGNQMWIWNGGEKNAFWISKAGNVQHPAGATSLGWRSNQAVWHGATDTGYNNSCLQSIMGEYGYINWLDWGTYGPQGAGDDGAYVDLSSDQAEPCTAYMTIAIATGVYLNIWRGNTDGTGSLNFDKRALLRIDADAPGGSGLRRFAPQLAPDKDTGCWITWSSSTGYVYIRYIPPDATSLADCGDAIRICPGAISGIHTDVDGNIHLAYVAGGLKYRKLIINEVQTGANAEGSFYNIGDAVIYLED